MEGTYWPPYYHRNTMTEFSGPIVYDQTHEWHKEHAFKPYGAAMTSTMTAHGPTKEAHEAARSDTLEPKKVFTDGISIFLLETECPLEVQSWAMELLEKQKNSSASKL